MAVVADPNLDSFTCKPWSNAGLGMNGFTKLELSGLNLVWTNGKLTQIAVMMNLKISWRIIPVKLKESTWLRTERLYILLKDLGILLQ